MAHAERNGSEFSEMDQNFQLRSFSYLQFPGARIVGLGLGFPCGTGVRVIVPGSGSSN